ncbi:MAG: hypothetical protein H0U95_02870 [Bacteroidetes bacterium]|nr:hypothetical protein [Bacteroidota bacterium]
MYKIFILFTILLQNSLAQTSTSGCNLSGGMGIYNACNNGQGCTGGCNLAATFTSFGPMCNGTTNNGNCFSSASGGHQTMSTSFSLPAGCTANVTAEFMKRGGTCTNSGMDGSDILGINSIAVFGTNVGNCGNGTSTPGVNPPGCLGAANADVNCTLTQTGGTIFIWGQANRSDEIITYTINLTGTCGPGCNGVLPISLKDFYAEPLENKILLKWTVATEKNVAYYLLEKSTDGTVFLPLTTVYSLANASGENNLSYFNYDYEPAKGINYYRLKNVNKDGSIDTHKTIAINFKNASASAIWVNHTPEVIKIGYEKIPLSKTVMIHDITGRGIKEISLISEAPAIIEISKTEFVKGVYLISGSDPQDAFSQKLIID